MTIPMENLKRGKNNWATGDQSLSRVSFLLICSKKIQVKYQSRNVFAMMIVTGAAV